MKAPSALASWILAASFLLLCGGCSRADVPDLSELPSGPSEVPVQQPTSFPELPDPPMSAPTATFAPPTPSATPSATAPTATATSRPGWPSGQFAIPGPFANLGQFTVPGQLLYVKDNHIHLWYRGQSEKLTVDARNTGPSWLPDARSFLFTRWSRGFSDLYRYYFDGRPVERLTDNDPAFGGRGAWATQATVSPAGQQALLISDRTTYWPALWLFDLPTRTPRLLATDPVGKGGLQDPAWQPNGEGLLAVFTDGTKSQIWSLQLATGRWTRVTSAADGAYAPAWHPSGEWIAYTERRGSAHDIWISRPDGKDAVGLTSDGLSRSPVWSPDGSLLAFASRRDNVFDLFVAQLDLMAAPPRLRSMQPLTRGAGIDPAGGLSWNGRE